MTGFRFFRIEKNRLESLARLRAESGIDVGAAEDGIWLRIIMSDPALRERVLRCLPDAEEFETRPDDTLKQINRRLPSTTIPDVTWEDIRIAVPIALPSTRFPARRVSRFHINFDRHAGFQQSNGILTSLQNLIAYCQNVPAKTFANCHYAVSDDGSAIVLGNSRPAVEGIYLIEQDRVIIPAGWRWTPAFSGRDLHRLFAENQTDYVLLQPEGDAVYSRITEDHFVPLTRSSLHETERELNRVV